MKQIYRILIVTIFLFLGSAINAQDSHLSQYDASPILLNPALTGVIDEGDFRIVTNYRSQWGSLISSSYTTTGLSFDTRYKDRWGVGGYITSNDLGGFIDVFNFMLSGSYQITEPTQNKYKITAGLQLGLLSKSLNQNEFVYDSQYENGGFNEDLSSGELFNRNSALKPDVNIGISYVHLDESWQIKPHGGFSLHHLTFSEESFASGDNDNLPLRWVFNGGADYEVNEKLKIRARSLFMIQRKAREFNFGGMAYYRINDTKYIAVGGLDFRWNDAVILNLGVKHKTIVYRFSYDFNTSSLQSASRGRGGTEISIVYTPSAKKESTPKVKTRTPVGKIREEF